MPSKQRRTNTIRANLARIWILQYEIQFLAKFIQKQANRKNIQHQHTDTVKRNMPHQDDGLK